MKTKYLWWTFFFMYIVWIFAMIFNVPFTPWGPIWLGIQLLILLMIVVSNVNDTLNTKIVRPEEGRKIRITWLPHCINVPINHPNPYIGMVGYVRELKPDGSFFLQCENSWLVVFGKYNFEYLD